MKFEFVEARDFRSKFFHVFKCTTDSILAYKLDVGDKQSEEPLNWIDGRRGPSWLRFSAVHGGHLEFSKPLINEA
jgi:hypothetical protein